MNCEIELASGEKVKVTKDEFVKYLRGGTLPMEINGETSDGYHTFNELYDHRNLLFIALCLHARDSARWRPHYPGWPVLFLELNGVQISYHVQEKFLPLFQEKIQRDDSYEWDGHESKDVLDRLLAFNDKAYKRRFDGFA